MDDRKAMAIVRGLTAKNSVTNEEWEAFKKAIRSVPVRRPTPEQLRFEQFEEERGRFEDRLELVKSGFSAYHIDNVADQGFDRDHPILVRTRPYFNGLEAKDRRRSWLFLLASSGTGKTQALHYLAWQAKIMGKAGGPMGYYVMGDLIDDIFNKKTTVEKLLQFRTLVLDDFFKEEANLESVRVHGLIKRLVDLYLRTNRTIWFAADIDLESIYNKLDPEYKDQIIYRIKERCGPNIFGFNRLPNLRKGV